MLRIIDDNSTPTPEEMESLKKFLARFEEKLEGQGATFGHVEMPYAPESLIDRCKPFWRGDGWRPEVETSSGARQALEYLVRNDPELKDDLERREKLRGAFGLNFEGLEVEQNPHTLEVRATWPVTEERRRELYALFGPTKSERRQSASQSTTHKSKAPIRRPPR